MLFKKILSISTLLILSLGYSQISQACEDKFTSAAFGSIERQHINQLKKKLISTQENFKDTVPVSLSDIQGILGFSGEQTKTASNNRVEHRIWIDRENCNRKIKASFNEGELVAMKIYGF
jgi:hypothetical protein